jgi:uncharacterized protein YciI
MEEEINQAFTYMAFCRFKSGSEANRMQLRPAHRQFIREHASRINWGGLLEKDGTAYGYCLLIKASSPEGAEKILGEDPYFAILEQSEVFNFLQRVPLQAD